jgi:hypothetical protein
MISTVVNLEPKISMEYHCSDSLSYKLMGRQLFLYNLVIDHARRTDTELRAPCI